MTRDSVNISLQWLHWYVEMLLQFQTVKVFPGKQQVVYTVGEEIQANIGLQREIIVFNLIFKIFDSHKLTCCKIIHWFLFSFLIFTLVFYKIVLGLCYLTIYKIVLFTEHQIKLSLNKINYHLPICFNYLWHTKLQTLTEWGNKVPVVLQHISLLRGEVCTKITPERHAKEALKCLCQSLLLDCCYFYFPFSF